MDETTLRASLPTLDIAISHRRSPTGDAETLSLHLTAKPSLAAVEGFLAAQAPLLGAGAAFNPAAAWMAGTLALWRPWFALWSAMLPAAPPVLPANDRKG